VAAAGWPLAARTARWVRPSGLWQSAGLGELMDKNHRLELELTGGRLAGPGAGGNEWHAHWNSCSGAQLLDLDLESLETEATAWSPLKPSGR
jgi:hypothetical protein